MESDNVNIKILQDTTTSLMDVRDKQNEYILELEEQVADLVIENVEAKEIQERNKKLLDWLAMYGNHSQNGCVVVSKDDCSCGWNDLKKMLLNHIEWNSDQERKNEH